MKIPRTKFGKKPYLKPSLLEERGLDSVTLTIAKGEIKLIGRGEKVVVVFKEVDFPDLIANVNQADTLLDLFGEESKDWVGQKILIRLEDAFNPQKAEPCKTINVIYQVISRAKF